MGICIWVFDRYFLENKWSEPVNVKENNCQHFFFFFASDKIGASSKNLKLSENKDVLSQTQLIFPELLMRLEMILTNVMFDVA